MFGVAQKLAPLISRSNAARLSLPASRGIRTAAPAISISYMNDISERFSSSLLLTCLPRNPSNNRLHGLFRNPSIGVNINSLMDKNGTCQARGFATAKHKRVIKLSRGFRGRANRCYRVAIRRLEKSWQYAFRDRKVKKRKFRQLWIQRLNAGVRQHDMSYSNFINMQSKTDVTLDRKILSGLAMYEPFSFKAVLDVVKKTAAEAGGK